MKGEYYLAFLAALVLSRIATAQQAPKQGVCSANELNRMHRPRGRPSPLKSHLISALI